MKRVLNQGSASWIDLESPTTEEVQSLIEEYNIDRSIAEDLLSPSARHKIEFGEKHGFIVLHFPTFKESTDGDAGYEFDFVVGDNFVITARYNSMPIIEKFASSFDSEIASENPRNDIFFGILNVLLTDFGRKLSDVDHWIRDAEKKMFEGHEKKTIFDLSEASRHLIDFKKISAVYPEALHQILEQGTKLFGGEWEESARNSISIFQKESAKLDTLSLAVKELRETNASLLSTKQNETMKVLTGVTIVISIIVGVALVWLGYLAVK